jgi:hypothetical protein
MIDKDFIKVTKLEQDIVNLEIPRIEVKRYPIWRSNDESDDALYKRAQKYARELIKRHDSGEPYAIGYREYKDGELHMVIRQVRDGVIFQKVLGFDDDFKEINGD